MNKIRIFVMLASLGIFTSSSVLSAQELCQRVERSYHVNSCSGSNSGLCNFLLTLYSEARLQEDDGTINIQVPQLLRDGAVPLGSGKWQIVFDSNLPGGMGVKYIGPDRFSTPGYEVIETLIYVRQAGVMKMNISLRRGCPSTPTECNDVFGEVMPDSGPLPEFLLANSSRVPASAKKVFIGSWQHSGVPLFGMQRGNLEWPHGVFNDVKVYFPAAGTYRLRIHARSANTEFFGLRLSPDSLNYEHPFEPTPLCSEYE